MFSNTFDELNLKIGEGKKFAIIVSRFNQKVTGGMLRGAVKSILEKTTGINNRNLEDEIGKILSGKENNLIEIFMVPGAVEIPLIAQKCANLKKENGKKKFDAVICLGCVIRGDTAHFDYVCKMVSSGIKEVSLKTETPILFGVITTENQSQAEDRAKDDEINKGREAALAAIEMIQLIEEKFK